MKFERDLPGRRCLLIIPNIWGFMAKPVGALELFKFNPRFPNPNPRPGKKMLDNEILG